MSKTLYFGLLAASLLLPCQVQAQPKTIVETAIEAGNFNTLVTAVKAAGLVETLNGDDEFTVFAPTDSAFADLDSAVLESLLQPENKAQLRRILTYHAVPGRVTARDAYDLSDAPSANGQRLRLDLKSVPLMVNDAQITVTDIQCSNGVIHVIDAVLLPNQSTVLANAYQAGNFSTLLAAIGIANLNDVLNGPGPFTVFAPTDDAFAALPAGTVDQLLQPENRDQLIDLLKYHVVPGRVYDDMAVEAGRARSLSGSSLDIGLSANGLSVNQAKVLTKNIEASNGLIHVIDQVLVPSKLSRRQVMTSLNDAIDRGVPVFNAGHHQRCCEIYMDAMTIIKDTGIDSMDDHSMILVEQTIQKAERTHNSTDRAWVLRRGMDQLYMRAQRMSTSIDR